MTGSHDEERFPAPVYRETVLAPLFEGVKRHHWRQQMRINRASAIMLAAQGLLTRRGGGSDPPGPRRHRARHRRPGARLHGRARGLLLPRPDGARAAARRRDGREAPHGPEPERHRPHGVQDGAQGAPRRPARRSPRGRLGPARGRGGEPRHAGGGVHPRPAGPADDLRALPRGAHRAPAPRRGAPAPGEPLPRSLQHGGGRDHDLRLPAGPEGDGRAPGLRRRPGQRLRLHRRQRLRHQRVRRAPAPLHPSRAVRAGPQRLDVVRGGAPPRPRRVRAGELDHAAEAEPRRGRAPAAPLLARRGPGRGDARRCSTTRRSPT